jgi:carbamoyl-phosphate synthase large subunit
LLKKFFLVLKETIKSILKKMNKDITVMIFGAGINQLELIRAAREMNIKSVVVDPATNPPGKPFADYFYRVEAGDYDTTRALALKHNIKGIVTGQMEKPMRLMARLAKELGFIFHSSEVVERSLDKWTMKQSFIGSDVPCAKGILIKPEEELTSRVFSSFSFPVIIKPRDSFSSRGVYKINSLSELNSKTDETRSFSSAGDIIVEEFLNGREFSVESVTWQGQTTIIQFTEKFITPYPRTVEIGHLQPANLQETEREQIKKVVVSGINALGIDNSASHAEVMLTSAGVKVIEIGARLGGDFISSYLTRSSTGVNMDKAVVSVALGLPPDLQSSRNCFSYIRYLELPVGRTVRKILPLDNLRKLPGVVFVWVFVKPSDKMLPIVHSALRPACILVKADSREDVIAIADRYINELKKLIITN